MTAMRTTGHDTTVKIESLPPARLPHLKSPDAATAARPDAWPVTGHPQHAPLPGTCFPAIPQSRGKPWPLFITTSDARPASGSRPIHAAALRGKHATAADPSAATHPRPARKRIHPFRARCGAPLGRYLPAPRAATGSHPRRQRLIPRRRPRRPPAGPPPNRHRPLRHRRSITAGGIGPALTTRLDPAGYPVVPGGVPQARERAQVYLGLCERYQELSRAQVAEMHLLTATVPGCSLPLSHRRALTSPLTDTHTGHRSFIRGAGFAHLTP